MTDIKHIISEEGAGGAVGGGAIASFAMPLLSQAIKRPIQTYKVATSKKTKSKKKSKFSVKESLLTALGESGMNSLVDQGSTRKPAVGDFDAQGVLSKLKAAEKKESIDRRNTETFGLEDDKGRLVRVTVPVDQADNFEQVLQHIVSKRDENEPTEVAELLFDLKNQFTFVDIEWPDIEEDEEVPAAPEGDLDLGLEGDGDGATGEGEVDMDFSLDKSQDTSSADDEVKGLLTKVIDMMKADAEARRREAIAREKEAEVRVGQSAVDQAMAKVKQEEQILDMEIWNKNQKEEKKEAKRLAQLARWKHEMSQDGDLELDDLEEIPTTTSPSMQSSEENEEKSTKTKVKLPKKTARVTPSDVASFIVKRMK